MTSTEDEIRRLSDNLKTKLASEVQDYCSQVEEATQGCFKSQKDTELSSTSQANERGLTKMSGASGSVAMSPRAPFRCDPFLVDDFELSPPLTGHLPIAYKPEDPIEVQLDEMVSKLMHLALVMCNRIG